MKTICLLLLLIPAHTIAQVADHALAADYAPIFYQALGDKPRGDYITNFDFDGDWRGDNNWRNTDDKRFRLRAYVYYAVSETRTHYFIQYAVFHTRDYKGGETKGVILSELLRQGAEAAGNKDPTGLLDEVTVAHENDMEGALVVVDKERKVAYVQTLHHNRFSTYTPNDLKMDGKHVLLYIEPKGHGIEAYSDSRKFEEKRGRQRNFITYKFTGVAGDPGKEADTTVGYALLPIATTLWKHAAGIKDKNTSYGAAHDYGEVTIRVAASGDSAVSKKVRVGKRGSAFLGRQGGVNMARPPWGWFDVAHRGDPLGLWFFDPATVLKRDLKLPETFSTVYSRLPFWART